MVGHIWISDEPRVENHWYIVYISIYLYIHPSVCLYIFVCPSIYAWICFCLYIYLSDYISTVRLPVCMHLVCLIVYLSVCQAFCLNYFELLHSVTIWCIFSLKSILHPMDAINQRYSRKRALYLAGLARHLSFASCVGSLHYSCLHGNRLRPILLLKPPGTIVTVVCGAH